MTPTDLKSARKALGKSAQALGEDLGYKGGHAGRQIRRMEAGQYKNGVPHRVEHGVRRLLVAKRDEIWTLLYDLNTRSEPVSAPHSEKWTLTGPAQPPE